MPNPRKRLGSDLERKVVADAQARKLKAKKQPLSGALPDEPNDAVIEGLLVECKVRKAEFNAAGEKHITIEVDWLDKALKNAKKAGYRSAVVVFRQKNSSRLLCIQLFSDFLAGLEERRGVLTRDDT
jgi:hypothetical protein